MSDIEKGPEGSNNKTKSTFAFLSDIQPILSVITLVVGSLWGLYTYIDHQKSEALLAREQSDKEINLRIFELRKSLYEREDTTNFEIGDVVGKLLVFEISSPVWGTAYQRYWEIYWGIFGMADNKLGSAMKEFGDVLNRYKLNKTQERDKLEHSARDLELIILDLLARTQTLVKKRYFPSPAAEGTAKKP
jgi:hypothetical protein